MDSSICSAEINYKRLTNNELSGCWQKIRGLKYAQTDPACLLTHQDIQTIKTESIQDVSVFRRRAEESPAMLAEATLIELRIFIGHVSINSCHNRTLQKIRALLVDHVFMSSN